MTEFVHAFIAALIGAAVGFTLLPHRPEERRCLLATVLQVLALALGFSSSQLAFYFFPQLHQGWTEHATVVILFLVMYLPASWWAVPHETEDARCLTSPSSRRRKGVS